jgi:hypothetical protein
VGNNWQSHVLNISAWQIKQETEREERRGLALLGDGRAAKPERGGAARGPLRDGPPERAAGGPEHRRSHRHLNKMFAGTAGRSRSPSCGGGGSGARRLDGSPPSGGFANWRVSELTKLPLSICSVQTPNPWFHFCRSFPTPT